MSMSVGTATVSADSNGNITLGGSGCALALAQAMQPSMTAAQILAFKTAINDPTKFQNALNAIFVTMPNQLAALVTYIQTNAVVVGSSIT